MIRLSAPAKVNLDLHVIGRRDDGYHDLVTRMQKLDLCDRISLELTDEPGIRFSCDDPDLPGGEGNLAVRAARAFLTAAGMEGRQGVEIGLAKAIPVAAGLGGGSSDAGTVLRGLNDLFGRPLSTDPLIEMACSLGADVPFFVVPYAAAEARGIGEKLQRMESVEGYWFLLVNPGFAVSTKWVFENYALTTGVKNSRLRGSLTGDNGVFCPALMHNDLEQVTMARYPVVTELKKAMLAAGAVNAMMSGSGPTVFGLFDQAAFSERQLYEVVERFSVVYGSRVYLTRANTGA